MTEPTVAEVDDHGQCPGCGAGHGRPHYERCQVSPPDYGRYITRGQIYGLTDYAIGIFPLDIVRRSTIRAMLPRGHTVRHPTAAERKAGKVSRNVVSVIFLEELKRLDSHGYIRRRDDHLLIVAREPVLRCARGQLRKVPELSGALHEALAGVAASLPEEITVAGRAQRAAELRALQYLMQQSPATGPHSGRGHADLVHKPGMI